MWCDCPLLPRRRINSSHFNYVHQSTILLYVTGGLVLAGAIAGGAGVSGGGSGRLLLVGPGLRWEPGKLRLGGGSCRSALRRGGLRCRREGSRGGRRGLRLGRGI